MRQEIESHNIDVDLHWIGWEEVCVSVLFKKKKKEKKRAGHDRGGKTDGLHRHFHKEHHSFHTRTTRQDGGHQRRDGSDEKKANAPA